MRTIACPVSHAPRGAIAVRVSDGPAFTDNLIWSWWCSLGVAARMRAICLDATTVALIVFITSEAHAAGQFKALFEWAWLEHHYQLALRGNLPPTRQTSLSPPSESEEEQEVGGDDELESGDELASSIKAAVSLLELARLYIVDQGSGTNVAPPWEGATFDCQWLSDPSQMLGSAMMITAVSSCDSNPRLPHPAFDARKGCSNLHSLLNRVVLDSL